jgi:menaquinone-dependent protoporphyrinogen oxidase
MKDKRGNEMNEKILVTYHSPGGSTRGVAEAIGQTLVEKGLRVDVLPMSEVKDLGSYRAVVAGSAVHGQKWTPQAMRFLREHRTELSRKPFAAFQVCITLSMKDADQWRAGVEEWLAPVRSLVRPVREGSFAGELDFRKQPFSLNTLFMRIPVWMGLWKIGDHRDWTAIRAWAESLPAALGR